MEDETPPQDVILRGILFSRSVRSTFASLTLAPVSEDGHVPSDVTTTTPVLLVRIQFFEQVKELRSYCRRTYKLGDWIEIRNVAQVASPPIEGSKATTGTTEWKQPRVVINMSSTQDSTQHLSVKTPQFWNMTQCQVWQNHRLVPSHLSDINGKKVVDPSIIASKQRRPGSDNDQGGARGAGGAGATQKNKKNHHGGGLGKRLQGEHIAKFLISSIMHKLAESNDERTHMHDPSTWSTLDHTHLSVLHQRAIDYLNTGSGVLDVAGGSGHVSMALGMSGVRSTVVDAREGVGKLPGKDRKIWNRAVKRATTGGDIVAATLLSSAICHPVVPFQAYRAWFGFRPVGVDSNFRHPDQEALPLCDEASDVLRNASAIVALHPDEATGDITRVAVHRRIPLVVVPCCVFARLFPNRSISPTGIHDKNNRVVSTYDDLLQYLMGHDTSIQKVDLPFDGKNTMIWSTFE